jgi:hypothetical protein
VLFVPEIGQGGSTTWEKSGEGAIDLRVVKLGGNLDKTNTQTVTVKLVAGPPAKASELVCTVPGDYEILGDPPWAHAVGVAEDERKP